MKSFYLSFLFLAFSFFANAQLYVGARVGLNVANQKVEINGVPIAQDPKSILVWDIVLPVEYAFSESFSLQTEFHFIQKGELAEFFDGMGDFVSVECRYNYFDIPLLAKLSFNSGGGKIFVIGGPFFSYGLGGTEFSMNGDQKQEREIDFEDLFSLGGRRNYDRVNFGATIGVGMDFLLNRGNIVTDLRYGVSFDNVFEETILNDVLTTRNFGIAITIGYMHNFGKKRKTKRKNIDSGYEILK